MSKSLAVITMVFALTTFMVTGCGGDGGDSSSSPQKASTAPSGDDASSLAQKMEKEISVKGAGFRCHWRSEDSDLVQLDSCQKHKIVLATATDSSAINLWAESMNEQIDTGWMAIGEHYAVISPDHATINRVMDLLGGDGAVKSLG